MSRVALQSLVRSRSIALRAPVRSFHRSSIVLASEVPNNPFGNSEKVQEFTEKVKAAPAVIAAIGTLTKLMVAKGIPITEAPSALNMAKLAVDGEARAAMQKIMEECNKAGIQFDSTMLESLKAAVGKGETK